MFFFYYLYLCVTNWQGSLQFVYRTLKAVFCSAHIVTYCNVTATVVTRTSYHMTCCCFLAAAAAHNLGHAVTKGLPVPSRLRRKSEVCCSTEICCKSWRTFVRPSCSQSFGRRCLLGTRMASWWNKNTSCVCSYKYSVHHAVPE
jgi:hypothetical protein